VDRVAVIGCPAPDDDPSFDVTAGMPEMNRESIRMLKENPEEERRGTEEAVTAFFEDPETFAGLIDSVLDPVDVAAARKSNVRAGLIEQWRDALKNGAEGWYEDGMITVRPWGFAPEDVRVEVWLWHGELDRLVPVSHGRHLAGRLPRCKGEFLPGDGHVSPIARLPEILDWLVQPVSDKPSSDC
jgi:pimeloyl-ACP methyl ester carboxylesterase